MKKYADSKRREVQLKMGDLVYTKLQPYRQSSVVVRPYPQLAKRYYGSFWILECIGKVAYRMDLPLTSKIYLVFHVALLKLHPKDLPAPTLALSPQAMDNRDWFNL